MCFYSSLQNSKGRQLFFWLTFLNKVSNKPWMNINLTHRGQSLIIYLQLITKFKMAAKEHRKSL